MKILLSIFLIVFLVCSSAPQLEAHHNCVHTCNQEFDRCMNKAEAVYNRCVRDGQEEFVCWLTWLRLSAVCSAEQLSCLWGCI